MKTGTELAPFGSSEPAGDLRVFAGLSRAGSFKSPYIGSLLKQEKVPGRIAEEPSS
jgi:hypothetical protein